ncbi:hypothetical protein FVEG_13144 [Fusarium verticillioides 7600]|uniref:Uncharacterized protein n=1 Tax=Gibberella moniliformis (strain M3125 / FGSC 7600) TaxID=334819 RepID=W7N602_GIBM7|nr:hypothetical protein FVEG_13144 [Fusarium verticillioides 7600]EWG55094.1 hypothetical protein FVEG_13144 [Fusarium verticillioides 7600]
MARIRPCGRARKCNLTSAIRHTSSISHSRARLSRAQSEQIAADRCKIPFSIISMPKSCDRPAYSVALAINSAKMTAKKCIMIFKSEIRTPSGIACDSAENLPLGAEKMAYRTRLGPACQHAALH